MVMCYYEFVTLFQRFSDILQESMRTWTLPRGEKGVVWQRRGVLFHCGLDLSHHMAGISSITLITVNQMSLTLMTSQ